MDDYTKYTLFVEVSFSQNYREIAVAQHQITIDSNRVRECFYIFPFTFSEGNKTEENNDGAHFVSL